MHGCCRMQLTRPAALPCVLQDPARHKEVDSLLGPTTDERFAALVALGKMITDYAPSEAVSWRCCMLWCAVVACSRSGVPAAAEQCKAPVLHYQPACAHLHRLTVCRPFCL